MSVIHDLTEEECYLLAILDDPSGIELAEFCFLDETPGKPDPCFRVRDYQWTWWTSEERYQIDYCSRDVGKSQGIQLRAFAFPFNFPGQEMLITAPQLNHLGPIVDKIEQLFMRVRLGREMLPKVKGGGIKHQPQFQASFINGAKIMGRLPGPTGAGVKGCMGAGTIVLTERGLLPIEDVVAGDQVWTHERRWREVLRSYRYDDAPVVRVRGGGHRGLVMSESHRMLVRRDRTEGKGKRDLGQETWAIMADEMEYGVRGLYLGSPTWLGNGLSNECPTTRHEAFILGRYVADGHLQYRYKDGERLNPNRLCIVTDDARVEELARRLGNRGSHQRMHNGTWQIDVCNGRLAELAQSDFGEHADRKTLPPWLFAASWDVRDAFLEGYLLGDGHWDPKRERWTASTASRRLAVGLRLLAQTLGHGVAMSWVDPKQTHVAGVELKKVARRSYRVTMTAPARTRVLIEKPAQWSPVLSVEPAGLATVYDLDVADDHSYLADGLFSHNQHSHRLEMDEAQDFPQNGWMELVETMKDTPGAQWRAHGVSRGVRDMYYRLTNRMDPDLPFFVHRFMAMHRPGWTDEERKSKIAIYGGSRDNPDYKRNVYGEHGDVTNPVFVLARLMACVRNHESTWASEYNENVYAKRKLEWERIENSGMPITAHLQLPASHKNEGYKSYWAGMDVGFTNDPSELLVFGQIKIKDKDVLRLLARIHMMRIPAPDQAAVISAVFAFYGPRLRALSIDKTGAGLPIWQETVRGGRLNHVETRLKGYGFSEKKAVAYDDRPLERRERPEDAMIEKNVIDHATDELRGLVDAGMLELPFDQELLTEFQGQVVVYARDDSDKMKRPSRYGGGSFHTLDAAKLAVLGKSLETIEAAMAKPRRRGPVLDLIG